MLKFHNEKITVTLADDGSQPASFSFGGKEYVIREISKVWQDVTFQAAAGRRGSAKQWWNQRGKTDYRVIVDEDVTFELYHDPRKDQWYLSKEWGQPGQD